MGRARGDGVYADTMISKLDRHVACEHVQRRLRDVVGRHRVRLGATEALASDGRDVDDASAFARLYHAGSDFMYRVSSAV